MSNSNQTNKTPWGTIIIVGLIIWFAWGYYSKKQEERRLAEENRRDAEAVGAFIGGALRELNK
jgi:hypothetical protein